MHYHGRTFTDAEVVLDGASFVDCVFVRCRLLVTGRAPFSMTGATFTECTYVFEGVPPADVVRGARLLFLHQAPSEDQG